MNSRVSARRLTSLRLQIVRLRRERETLEGYLMKPPPMYPGTLLVQRMRCGKKSCHCQRRGGVLHGPYHYIHLKVNKRYTSRYLGHDHVKIKLAGAFKEYVGKIARYRSLQKKIDELFTKIRDLQIIPWKEMHHERE